MAGALLTNVKSESQCQKWESPNIKHSRYNKTQDFLPKGLFAWAWEIHRWQKALLKDTDLTILSPEAKCFVDSSQLHPLYPNLYPRRRQSYFLSPARSKRIHTNTWKAIVYSLGSHVEVCLSDLRNCGVGGGRSGPVPFKHSSHRICRHCWLFWYNPIH